MIESQYSHYFDWVIVNDDLSVSPASLASSIIYTESQCFSLMGEGGGGRGGRQTSLPLSLSQTLTKYIAQIN